MAYTTTKINGTEYAIIADFQDCRDGFNHIAKIYMGHACIGYAKRHYINRTWECFRYQSAVQAAIYDAINSMIERRKEAARRENGGRLRRGQGDQIAEEVRSSEYGKNLLELLEAVRTAHSVETIAA